MPPPAGRRNHSEPNSNSIPATLARWSQRRRSGAASPGRLVWLVQLTKRVLLPGRLRSAGRAGATARQQRVRRVSPVRRAVRRRGRRSLRHEGRERDASPPLNGLEGRPVEKTGPSRPRLLDSRVALRSQPANPPALTGTSPPLPATPHQHRRTPETVTNADRTARPVNNETRYAAWLRQASTSRRPCREGVAVAGPRRGSWCCIGWPQFLTGDRPSSPPQACRRGVGAALACPHPRARKAFSGRDQARQRARTLAVKENHQRA